MSVIFSHFITYELVVEMSQYKKNWLFPFCLIPYNNNKRSHSDIFTLFRNELSKRLILNIQLQIKDSKVKDNTHLQIKQIFIAELKMNSLEKNKERINLDK